MAACLLAGGPVMAAEPVRIGVTTILSGQYADRGQSEQYGVELALQRINEAGGVLGRPVEAFYGDNAADETIAKETEDLTPLCQQFKALAPDRIVTVLSTSTAAFFHAYEQSGGSVPITGRIDFPEAMGAVSPQFLAAGGLDGAMSITVFNPLIETPGVQDFVQAYRAKYGIMPTQRSFFAYEAANLVVDAIRRAGSDKSEDIRQALKTTKMPSLLGGTYAMDDHNHSHTPMQIMAVRAGKVSVIAQVGG